MAERAGISRASLWAVEKGSPSVALGIYAAVLHALNGLDTDLLLVAKDDELGRKLQDLDLQTKNAHQRKSKNTPAAQNNQCARRVYYILAKVWNSPARLL